MGQIHSAKIVTDGLVLCMDAANPRSWVGTGSSWLDLAGGGSNFAMATMSYDAGAQGSFLFDGASSRASGPSISLGQYGTVNVWFRQATSTVNKGLFGISSGTYSTWFYIGGVTSTSIGISNGGYASPQYSNDITIPANRKTSWNMATYTWADSSVTVALNAGSPVTTSSYGFIRSGSSYIGVFPTLAPSSYFNGYISCVQVYSRALTASEVSANYRAMLPRYL